jgi:hypothetical protein
MSPASWRTRFDSLVKSCGPYLGVISAALIFLSWLVSTSALDHETKLRTSLREAVTRQEDFHRHLDLVQKLNNAEKQLTRIELYRRPNESSAGTPSELTRAGDNLQWADAWSSDVSELQEYADQIRDFVKAGSR